MPETDHLALPYPASNDLATVPAHIQDLAEAAESHLVRAGAVAKRLSIASEQSTSSGTPALLGTPDRIQNLVLGTAGLIWVAFEARALVGSGSPTHVTPTLTLDSTTIGASNFTPAGIPIGILTTGGIGDEAFEATDFGVLPPRSRPVAIKAEAGTHSVSVLWSRGGSGSVTILDRTLVVWTQEFQDVSP